MKENVLKITPPKVPQSLDWIHNAMPVVTSNLIIKSFQACGLSGPLKLLYEEKLLNGRRINMLDHFLKDGELDVHSEYMDEGHERILAFLNDSEIVSERND